MDTQPVDATLKLRLAEVAQQAGVGVEHVTFEFSCAGWSCTIEKRFDKRSRPVHASGHPEPGCGLETAIQEAFRSLQYYEQIHEQDRERARKRRAKTVPE